MVEQYTMFENMSLHLHVHKLNKWYVLFKLSDVKHQAAVDSYIWFMNYILGYKAW